jgi:hypothetical protein
MKLDRIEPSLKPKYKMVARFITDSGEIKSIHFGARGYNDYTIYSKMAKQGKITQEEADAKKQAYISRHKVNENFEKPDSAGALAKNILWNKPTIKESIADFKKQFKL